MNAEREEFSEELAAAVELANNAEELTAEEFEMVEAMEDGPDLSDYVQVDDGAYLPADETQRCPCCESVYRDTEDFNEVNVSRSWRSYARTENWCESCTNDDAFYCDWRSEYYSSSAFSSVYVDGDTVCMEANEDSLYYWESDGEYHSEPEPEGDEYGIPDYHSGSRSWTVPRGSEFTLGVELETYCPDPSRAFEARPDGMLGERDGSLDSEHGVEFIGPPMTFTQYQNGEMWAGHLDNLRKFGASSWETPCENSHGMHISVGRQNLDNAHASRFCLFINVFQALSEKVAGRSANSWAGYELKDAHDVNRRLTGDAYCGKYNATNIQPERIEVRIFRGTLATHGFMRNIEYVQSVLEYTAQCSAIGPEDKELYYLWLVDNARRFPNLCAKLESAGYIRLPALLAA